MIQHNTSHTIRGQFVRNLSTTGYASVTEIGTIPSSAPFTLELAEKVADGATITAEIDGSPAEVVPWSYAPDQGQVAVNRPRGLVKLNAADAGLSLEINYTPAGTVITASKLNALLPNGLSTSFTVGGYVLTFVDGVLVSREAE